MTLLIGTPSTFENKTMAVAPDIYAKVASIITEALVVEKQDITPKARLQRDLGADSLDLLEITFRLEHAFGIEIPLGELFPDSTFRLDPELLQDGKLTDKGIAEIHSRLPYADLTSLKDDRRLGAVPDLFTVGLVAAYVAWKLGRGDSRTKSHSQRDVLEADAGPMVILPSRPNHDLARADAGFVHGLDALRSRLRYGLLQLDAVTWNWP